MMHNMHDLQCLNACITPGCYIGSRFGTPPHGVPARPPPPAPRHSHRSPRAQAVPRFRRHGAPSRSRSSSPSPRTRGLPRCRGARSRPPSSPRPARSAWAPRRRCYPRTPGGRPSLGSGSEAPCLDPSSPGTILAVGGGCSSSPSCR